MKNSSNNAPKGNNKKVNKARVVFGKAIPASWRNEQKLILKAIESFEGSSNPVPATSIVKKAISLRIDKQFDLKPFDALATKVQRNFVNRIYRTLGGTIISANNNPSAQNKFFNFEVQTGRKLKFVTPIDPTEYLSKQVNKNSIVFARNFKVANIKQNKSNLETLTPAQTRELNRFKGIDTTNPNDVPQPTDAELIEEASSNE